MAEDTPGTEAMKLVIATVHPTLKDLGFRKRKHGFNRTTEDGLTHVIHFQRGQKPGIYDQFTVNIGVFIPEAFLIANPSWDVPAFINEFDCQIRQRIGLVIGDRDIWWDLSEEDPEELGENLRSYISGTVLDWIDKRARSRDAMLDFYERSEEQRQVDQAMAVVAAEQGDKHRAKRFMQRALDSIGAMARADERQATLHQGWIDMLRQSHIEPYGLVVDYPVIEPARG
jgi:hypothetical protein